MRLKFWKHSEPPKRRGPSRPTGPRRRTRETVALAKANPGKWCRAYKVSRGAKCSCAKTYGPHGLEVDVRETKSGVPYLWVLQP